MPSTNPMERPELALANLIRGEPGASLRALFRPDSLSPVEQQDLIKQLDLKPNGGFSEILMGIATNPMVVLGTIASMRFPVATLANLNKFSGTVTKAAERFGFMAKLKDFTQIFKDRPALVEAWTGAFQATKEVKEKYMLKARDIMVAYEKETGKVFGDREDFIIQAVRRGLHKGVAGHKSLVAPLNAKALMADYTPALQRAGDKFGSLFNDFWTKVVNTPDARKAMGEVAKLKHVGLGSKVEGYTPNILDRSRMGAEIEAKFMAQSIGVSENVQGIAQQAGIMQRVSPSAFKRIHGKFQLIPNPDKLQMFPEYVNKPGMEGLIRRVNEVEQVTLKVGDEFVSLDRVYEPGLTESFSRYVNTMAATHGWTVKGRMYQGQKLSNGRIINAEVDALRYAGDGHSRARAQLVANTYIPLAKGVMTPKQAMAAQQWGSTVDWTVGHLTGKGPLSKLVPKNTKKWLLESITKDRGPLSLQNISGGAAGWLYLGTLGANAGSATLNLMQSFLTTAPLIGTKATLKGMERTFSKARRYMQLRQGGMGFEEALAKTFPQYAKAGVSGHSIADDAIRNSFSYAWDEGGVSLPGRYTKGWDRVKRGLMSLFSHTEQFNRITAFEGATWKGLNEGMKQGTDELLMAARDVVARTQFMAGKEYAPAFLVDKNPLIRQYLMFPSKMLEFVMDTAVTSGSGVQSGMLGRNWGTLGRAVAASGIMYEGAKGMGMDISGGLLTGTLPIPRGDGPFGVFPFVPPALQLGGSLVQSAIEGDTTPLRRSLPMLVPGGLATSRAIGFMPGQVGRKTAEVLGRHYADYNQITPDGRVAIFSHNGSLTGYSSILSMIAKGSGVPGSGAEFRQESEMLQMLLQNKDRIGEARAEYLNAMYLHDSNKMTNIREQFERAYGMKLEIKKSHVKAMQMKRTVPRLERVLQGMPPEHRQQFAQIIQTAMFANGSQFLGIDPSLLGVGSLQSREGQRAALPSGFHRSGSYTGQMGPFGNLNSSNLGRNQMPNPTASSPLAIGGF